MIGPGRLFGVVAVNLDHALLLVLVGIVSAGRIP